MLDVRLTLVCASCRKWRHGKWGLYGSVSTSAALAPMAAYTSPSTAWCLSAAPLLFKQPPVMAMPRCWLGTRTCKRSEGAMLSPGGATRALAWRDERGVGQLGGVQESPRTLWQQQRLCTPAIGMRDVPKRPISLTSVHVEQAQPVFLPAEALAHIQKPSFQTQATCHRQERDVKPTPGGAQTTNKQALQPLPGEGHICRCA